MKYPAWLTVAVATGLSISAIAPVMAQDTSTPDKTESTSTDYSQTIKGTIKSIIGQLVILDLDNGGTSTLTLSREQIASYGLSPGMYLVATQKNGMVAIESATSASVASSESSTANRILSIKIPEVSRETTSSDSTIYTESSTSENSTVRTTTTIETAPPPPEPLPATPRALW